MYERENASRLTDDTPNTDNCFTIALAPGTIASLCRMVRGLGREKKIRRKEESFDR